MKTRGSTDEHRMLMAPEAEATPALGSSQRTAAWGQYVPLLVWVLSLCAIVFIPLRIAGHGYLPFDDALRHAAKVISGKDWNQIVLLADWVKMDHNPGWHAILGAVHNVTHWNTDTLVMFSIAALFIAYCVAPLIWMRRPETWLAVLIAASFVFPVLVKRLAYGRPLLVSAAVLMAVLLMWTRESKSPVWKRMVASAVLFAAAAWIHGSWYLFALPVLAFACAQQWRTAAYVGVAWLGGSFLGGMFTGHPFVFLWQAIEIPLHCFGANIPVERLAIEFKPSGGDLYACILVAAVVGWKLWRGASLRSVINNAPFILMVIAFLLGLKVMRFWLDWGLPALLCWLALQLDEPLERLLPENGPRRLGFALVASIALVICFSNDRHERWSASVQQDFISANDPEATGWLPEPGGTMYNPQMDVFFRWFYKNPTAQWKYVLGFEPTLMPPEHFAGYETILHNPHAGESYRSWVEKMRPADRMIISRGEPLAIAELEWKRLGRMTWIGRLPRVAANTATAQ